MRLGGIRYIKSIKSLAIYRRVGRQDDTNMGGKVLNMEKGYSKMNFTSCIILPKTGIEDNNTGKNYAEIDKQVYFYVNWV